MISTGDLPAIIGAVGLLVGTVFTGIIGLGQRRTRIDGETLEELEHRRDWQPRARRAVVMLREVIAELKGTEPPEVASLLKYPPPTAKHARPEEVTAGDPE